MQNLSEYNLSNYGSIKHQKDLKNNFQFAKTIVQIDDDGKKGKTKGNVENFEVNLEEPKILSGNRSRVAMSVNSNTSNARKTIFFF